MSFPLEGRPSQIRSGTTYVVLNVVESLVLLMAVGLVYAATGTLSMADLPAALAEPVAHDQSMDDSATRPQIPGEGRNSSACKIPLARTGG